MRNRLHHAAALYVPVSVDSASSQTSFDNINGFWGVSFFIFLFLFFNFDSASSESTQQDVCSSKWLRRGKSHFGLTSTVRSLVSSLPGSIYLGYGFKSVTDCGRVFRLLHARFTSCQKTIGRSLLAFD